MKQSVTYKYILWVYKCNDLAFIGYIVDNNKTEQNWDEQNEKYKNVFILFALISVEFN